MAITTDGQVYDKPVSEYLPEAFSHAENGLRAALNTLYVQSEGSREAFMARVDERLRACQFLGMVANIPLPTPVMSEAEGALGIVKETEV